MNEFEPSPAVPLFDTPAAIIRRDRRRRMLALAGIGAIALGSTSAFAWTAGWLGGGDRLTAQRVVGTMEANGPAHPGFRRNHAKGVCVAGTFRGTAHGQALSTAKVFSGEPVPVLGRFSIGGPNPHGADNNARVRSMALQLGGPDESQWRMALNSFPFFRRGDATSVPRADPDQAPRPRDRQARPRRDGSLPRHPPAGARVPAMGQDRAVVR